jgi:tyrosinase
MLKSPELVLRRERQINCRLERFLRIRKETVFHFPALFIIGEANMEDRSVLSSLFSRREFIKGVGAFSAASATIWAGGCEACLTQIQQQIANRPTRKNIQTLWDASHSDPVIATYKSAVQKMKALSSSDPSNPLGWEFQAQIHNSSCLHRNWLWLPWHRVYLVYFERICRKLTGDDTFAMPYWNWNTHPAIPDPFWDTSSSLYDSNRAATQGETADQSYIGTSVLNGILGQTNFELFASLKPLAGQNLHFPSDGESATEAGLEPTPHDNIHGFVGGDMGGFLSPRDPLFYTHHCMIDCLWAHWNIDLGNANTNDTDWTSYVISDFYDENGNSVKVPVAETILFPLLTYQYEPCSFLNQGAGNKKKLEGKALEQFLRAGTPSKLEFVQRFEVRQEVAAEIRKAATVAIKVQPGAFSDAIQGGSRNRVVLTIAGVEIPAKRDFYVRVFLNKPDVSAETPIEDPHYAGSFGFFYDEASMKKHGGEQMQASGAQQRPRTGYLVDVTATLQKLNQGGSLASEVNVSFVPVPYSHRESTGHLTLQRLELAAVRF